MVCPACSAINPDNLKFCGHCGRGLQGADDAQTVMLDGPAAAAAVAKAPQTNLGVISPPPEVTQGSVWGTAAPSGMGWPAAFAPGTAFGTRYRIESLLGEGGMGAVYKAWDLELDRTVALKLVRPELATSPQTMQRFKQELLLASRISHKNVLRIHDLGDWNGIKFITMAFVEGPDLSTLLEQQGRLPLERALKFARQLCGALEAAHHEGVVHRDLKPQNILIDSGDNAYVSDFGLAKSLESEATMMTRTGQILGTPRYMSPEQVEAVNVDHRSDLYSLGLILYEMFTGELPFRGDSAMKLMYQRVTERPADPRTVYLDLPEYVAAVILKCLEKDPDKRYQNAREILDDLNSMQATAVLTAPAKRAGSETISIQIPKPKASWWLAAVGAVAIGCGLVVAIPTTRHWILRAPADSGAAAKPLHYLALLPLNVVGDESMRYVADGVVEALSAKFAGLRNVYIASGNAVTAAAGRADLLKDPAKLAKTLGVKLLVRGTVQSAGDRIAITVRMDDVAARQTLLNREFDGNRRDLLVLENDMFTALANGLAIRQSNQERARSSANPTGDYDAYDLYMQGRNLLRGKRDQKNLASALELFDRARKRDPLFALAYAGIADGSILMYTQTKEAKWANDAVFAAEQAERLNPNLAEAHSALGTSYTATGKTQQGIAELQEALRLAPNSDDALRRLGQALEQADRKQEAIAAYTRAKEINPYLWRNFNDLGSAYVRFGENEKARATFEEATRLQPDNPSAWANLGVVYFNQNKWNECIPQFQKAIELDPKPLYYSNVGVAQFFSGRYQDAVSVFARAVEMKPNDASFRANLGDAYRASGDQAKAAAAYDQAIALAFKALEVNPKDAEALGIVAISYAKKNDGADALTYIRQARQIKRENDDLMYKEATIHALAGRTGEALASLADALRHGYSLEAVKADPELKALRAKPEFEGMLKELAKPAK